MKLEVGKYYKSRDGQKWKCVHEFKGRDDIFFPMICVENDFGSIGEFTKDGAFATRTHDNTLISEWVEPVELEVDVWFYKNSTTDNEIMATTVRPHDNYQTKIAKVKVKFTEGEGL